jgi:hypothetical protein
MVRLCVPKGTDKESVARFKVLEVQKKEGALIDEGLPGPVFEKPPLFCRTIIEKCEPKDAFRTALENPLQQGDVLLRAAGIMQGVFWSKTFGPPRSDRARDFAAVTVVDVGQVRSTMAVSTRITGTLFVDGEPGSVKACFDDTFVSAIKTRDPNDVMANALVFATALAFSDVIVLPMGGGIERIERALRLGIERMSDFMMDPGEFIVPHERVVAAMKEEFPKHKDFRWNIKRVGFASDNPSLKKVVICRGPGVRDAECSRAVEVVRQCLERFGRKKIEVVAVDALGVVANDVGVGGGGAPKLKYARLRKAIGLFGAVNDYADFFDEIWL